MRNTFVLVLTFLIRLLRQNRQAVHLNLSTSSSFKLPVILARFSARATNSVVHFRHRTVVCLPEKEQQTNIPIMFKKQDRRQDNHVNAGSMADIAFLLLIFFLVTTTILVDTGIQARLPVWVENMPPKNIPERNVLKIKINAQNELFVENGRAEPTQLRSRAKDFIMNPGALPTRPGSPRKAVISLQHDRGTSYQAYLEVYNELIGAYQELWEEEAQRRYQLSYEGLPVSRQQLIRAAIPLVISEAEPVDLMAGE